MDLGGPCPTSVPPSEPYLLTLRAPITFYVYTPVLLRRGYLKAKVELKCSLCPVQNTGPGPQEGLDNVGRTKERRQGGRERRRKGRREGGKEGGTGEMVTSQPEVKWWQDKREGKNGEIESLGLGDMDIGHKAQRDN